MQINDIVTSTSFRLSFAFAAILILSFVLAISLTSLIGRKIAERQLRERIALEVQALSTEYTTEGLLPTKAAINARAERAGAPEYWLTSPAGLQLIGDLPAPAMLDGWHEAVFAKDTQGAEGHQQLLVLTTTMTDGTRLSVGDNLQRSNELVASIIRLLVMIGAAATLLGLIAGTLLTRRLLASMVTLDATMKQVASGNLDARAAVSSGKFTHDIDRLAQAVNAMLDQIDELVRGMRRVTQGIAHDLRTPLMHLRLRIEEARETTNEADRQLVLDAAEQKIADILCGFDGLLRLAEVESGTPRARFADIDAAALLERIVDAYRPDIESGGRQLDIIRLDAAMIFGDADLLTQTITNLIDNAIRHTPPGTRITLRLAAVAGQVLMEVADDGPGIAAHEIEQVLKPFHRLERSRSTPGFGLGLSLVASVAQLHYARLELIDAHPGLSVQLWFGASNAHRLLVRQ